MKSWIKDFFNVEFKKGFQKMKKFFLFLFLTLFSLNPVLSQSNLLERVKKNPADAIKMCDKFKD